MSSDGDFSWDNPAYSVKAGKRLKIPSYCHTTVRKTNVLRPLDFLLPVSSAQNVIHRIYKSSAEKSKVLSWSTLAGMTVQVGKDYFFFRFRIIIYVRYFVFIREDTFKKKVLKAWPKGLTLIWIKCSKIIDFLKNLFFNGQAIQ